MITKLSKNNKTFIVTYHYLENGNLHAGVLYKGLNKIEALAALESKDIPV